MFIKEDFPDFFDEKNKILMFLFFIKGSIFSTSFINFVIKFSLTKSLCFNDFKELKIE